MGPWLHLSLGVDVKFRQDEMCTLWEILRDKNFCRHWDRIPWPSNPWLSWFPLEFGRLRSSTTIGPLIGGCYTLQQLHPKLVHRIRCVAGSLTALSYQNNIATTNSLPYRNCRSYLLENLCSKTTNGEINKLIVWKHNCSLIIKAFLVNNARTITEWGFCMLTKCHPASPDYN